MIEVAFDLDGTLIDSYRDIARALNATLTALGRAEQDPEVVKTMIGSGVSVLLERGLGSDDPELVGRARALFRDHYAAGLVIDTRPYAGVPELLTRLAGSGVLLSIATNKPSFFTRPLITRLGLDRAGIRGVACADEVPARKPDPAVVWLARARARRHAGLEGPAGAETLRYVGDMPIDAATARAAGCPFIGVAWGFDPLGLERERPDVLVESPAELERALRSRRGEVEA